MVAVRDKSHASPVADELLRLIHDARPDDLEVEFGSAAVDEWQRFFNEARPQRRRTIRQFAEEEIIIPEGEFKDLPFDCRRQPYTELWLNAVDDALRTRRYRRFFSTGPTQSGKSLLCFVIVILYFLFEMRETVICGVPKMDIANDKWEEDILPALEASRFNKYRPVRGQGSKGGAVRSAVRFTNGVTLRFMSGGGDDKSRASFTARVVVITETDGFDEPGSTSREADKFTQLEARTSAYDDRALVFGECTVSIAAGRTWRELKAGTDSRIMARCPHCSAWVTPEREHLVGWEEAEDELAARDGAAFCCPECGVLLTAEDRERMNADLRLLHRGQEIAADGTITGEAPRTITFGFRWSAFHNLFTKPATLGLREWKARRSPEEDVADREMCQFVWAIPPKDLADELERLDPEKICARITNEPKGVVPLNAEQLALGCDIGKYVCHWVLTAFRSDATPHIVDYGTIDVPASDLGVEYALLAALRDFRDEMILPGWPVGRADSDRRMSPALSMFDSRWQGDEKTGSYPIFTFTRESGSGFLSSMGYGALQQGARSYRQPTKTGAAIVRLGQGWYIARQRTPRVRVLHFDADHWKSQHHGRLATPVGQPGGMTIHHGRPIEHLSLAKHFAAEHKLPPEFKAGHGMIVRWENSRRRKNHLLDASVLALVAGDYLGAKLIGQPVRPSTPSAKPRRPRLMTPDGRPFLITER